MSDAWKVKFFHIESSRRDATLSVTVERNGKVQIFSRTFTGLQYLYYLPVLEILRDSQGASLNQSPDLPDHPESGSLQFVAETEPVASPTPLAQHVVTAFSRWWRLRDDGGYEGRVQIDYAKADATDAGAYHMNQMFVNERDPKSGDPVAWLHIVSFLKSHKGQKITFSGANLRVGYENQNDGVTLSVQTARGATLSVGFNSTVLTATK